MTKFYIFELENGSGEEKYWTQHLEALDDDVDPEEWIDEHLSNWYGEHPYTYKDGNWYFRGDGCVCVRCSKIKEVTEAEFIIIGKVVRQ